MERQNQNLGCYQITPSCKNLKEKLPKKFDVFASACLYNFKHLEANKTIIPGDLIIPNYRNLTTIEAFEESTLYIHGDLWVDGSLTCMNLVVCGNVYGTGDIDCLTCKIGGMIAGPVEINTNSCLLRSCILLQD